MEVLSAGQEPKGVSLAVVGDGEDESSAFAAAAEGATIQLSFFAGQGVKDEGPFGPGVAVGAAAGGPLKRARGAAGAPGEARLAVLAAGVSAGLPIIFVVI
jgi:hypothetical protein